MGNALNVVNAVDAGSVDVGAIESEIYDRIAQERKTKTGKGKPLLKSIMTTPTIPFEVLIANSNELPNDVVGKLKQAVDDYIVQFEKTGTVKNDKQEEVMDEKEGFPYSSFRIKDSKFFKDVMEVYQRVSDYEDVRLQSDKETK